MTVALPAAGIAIAETVIIAAAVIREMVFIPSIVPTV
jgi:hypothetical protein